MAAPKRTPITRGARTWERGGEAFRFYGAGTKLASIDGLTEARAALLALPDAFREAVTVTIAEAAEIIETDAKRRAPVRSGELRDSIGSNIRADGLQAAIGSGAPHAPFVEFGTKTMPAQPWLYPAFRAGARYVRASIKNWTKEAGEMVRASVRRGKNAKIVAKVAKRGQKYVGRPRPSRKGRAERAGR